MLVLSRKPGECLVIGDVVVRVLHSSASRVSIGVEADRDVPIFRGEVLEGKPEPREDAA